MITKRKQKKSRQQLNLKLAGRQGFGLNEVIGIAAGIIIAAFIIVPGLKEIAREMMDRLKSWWANIQNEFFPM